MKKALNVRVDSTEDNILVDMKDKTMQTLRLRVEDGFGKLKISGCLFLAITLYLMLPGDGFSAGAFDLRVNDVSGLDAPWPMVGGLPFPEGALHDASHIRIVDGQSHEVPAQIDVAATWRDGSIRWALAGFTANPRGNYRVEFGPDVSRRTPETPIRVERDAAGILTVDTGEAVYEFLPDRLLPENARLGEKIFLAGSGDGAYLLDNHGRLSRVAGPGAEIKTEIIRQGPMRTVVKREGWYVTAEGDRIARARAWFYLSAGTPHLKITHSLIFTEDTNDLWVRDYGLEFRTPETPGEVVFAHREGSEAEKAPPYFGRHRPGPELGGVTPTTGQELNTLSQSEKQARANIFFSDPEKNETLIRVAPEGGEVYMLQDIYPHFLEREFRAVIGRAGDRPEGGETLAGNFWLEPWEKTMDVAGDWGDGNYSDHGLTVVVPWLAEQFPKEIAFGPAGARVALWSGRSTRELDFRPLTLVNEYWKDWATGIASVRGVNAPKIEHAGGIGELSEMSNARGAARTHDIWLLPRNKTDDEQATATRARAASRPPLVQPDPAWLCATEVVWFPMHPKDEARFAREEAVISDFWHRMMLKYSQLRRTGFLDRGAPPLIRSWAHGFFRLGKSTDYNLRRNVWLLYGRSGERKYQEFGSRLNRFIGDWELSHWTAGEEYRGKSPFGRGNAPLHWGNYRALFPLQSTENWLLEHYLTGDEYMLELARLSAGVIREHWDSAPPLEESLWPQGPRAIETLITAYAMDWDENLLQGIRKIVHELIDLDAPHGIRDDALRYGSLYKMHEPINAFDRFYRVAGDEKARRAMLKAADYMYRFNMRAGGGANHLIYGNTWRWTGNPDYLRVLNAAHEQLESYLASVNYQWRFHGDAFYGAPMAMAFLSRRKSDDPIEPFPVLSYTREAETPEILFSKERGRAVEIGAYLRLRGQEHEDADPRVLVALDGSEVEFEIEVEKAYRTHYAGRGDERGRHIRLTLPAPLPAGEYTLRFPNAEKVVLLDSDAGDIRLNERETPP